MSHTNHFQPMLEQEFSSDEIIIVKTAVGGVPISRWVSAETGKLYQKLIIKTKDTLGANKPGSITFI
jgi:hypothetical protein